MSQNKRLKILIVTNFLPFPLSSGGRICLFNFVDYLREQHDFTLLVPYYSYESKKDMEKFNQIWPNVSLVHVDLTKSSEKISISNFFTRLVFFSKRKLDNIYNKITFDNGIDNSYKLDFTTPFKPKAEKYLSALKETCVANNFDIIQIQSSGNLNLIESLPTKSKKIFEQIESQFNILKDYAKSKKMNVSYADYLIKNSESLENFYINKYDAVFTLNESDSNYFKSKILNPQILTSPFGVLNKDIPKNIESSFMPKKIIFSGNELHYPNFDALEWYLSEIHTLVYEKHKLTLHITGNWSADAKKYFKSVNSKIKFDSFVDNYSTFLKDSIVIVPIRIGGGGLRTKILYGMANGAPVVSTSIGSFGIDGKHKEHFYIADSKTDFINSIEELITKPKETSLIIKNAYSLILDKYNQTQTAEVRNRQYLELIADD